MTGPERAGAAAAALDLVEQAWPGVLARGGCVHATAALAWVLRRRGVRVVPQGGTAQWRRLPEALDDGVVSTHFAYELDAAPAIAWGMLRAGLLPEMHVWAYLPDQGELVDLVTGGLPGQCEARAGLPWLAERPAPWSWWRRDALPPGVYLATELGTAIAFEACAGLLRELIR